MFDGFLAHCETCIERDEYSPTTLDSYRRNLEIWRTDLGAMLFLAVTFSTLTKIADTHRRWSRKTYKSSLSVLRRAFAFGYRNHPRSFNPASALKAVRLHPHEQPKADPFRIVEAEALVAGIHADWGEAQGNYDELRFFTGLRPSEEIALTIRDYDPAQGTLAVTKACVRGIYKDCTKTRQDRVIALSPRAIGILQRQLELRERLHRAGLIKHEWLFFHQDGRPIRSLIGPARRWRKTLKRLNIRYRRPYVARHTSVSWNLMIGKSPLYNAKQHRHGIATMWKVYSGWTQGAPEAEIKMIRRAMQSKRAPRSSLTASWAVLRPVEETVQVIRRAAQSAWRRLQELTSAP